jgi:hypothetical protein
MDVHPPRQRSNQDDFSGSSSAGQLGSAFPPFAKSAKDGADTAGRTDVFTRGSRNGAPDRLWQGKKYAPLLLTQYTSEFLFQRHGFLQRLSHIIDRRCLTQLGYVIVFGYLRQADPVGNLPLYLQYGRDFLFSQK